jgi:hypothetical protein
MKINSLHLFLLLICSMLMVGCATNYVPNVKIPKPDEIANIPAGIRISVVNAQPATEKLEITQHGTGYTVYSNLRAWTDQAVRGLSLTLQKKGAVVTSDASKSLKIAVTKAILSSAASGWGFRCTIVFTIDTGDGNLITLGADDTSWKLLSACDGAMHKLVLVTLNDERVVKFLAAP